MDIAIDFDGTLCPDHHRSWPKTPPDPGAVAFVRAMKAQGHHITILSCRGHASLSGGWRARHSEREIQVYLDQYGIPWDRIDMTKPLYDVLVDRRALHLDGDWPGIAAYLAGRQRTE